MIFRKKREIAKVSKTEFLSLADRIKSHFLRLKDMQIHTLNRINIVNDSHQNLDNHVNNNFNVIFKWLDYFNKMHQKHITDISKMEGTITDLNRTLDNTEKIDEKYIKKIVENYIDLPRRDRKNMEKELLSQLQELRDDNNGVINVNNVNNDYNATRYNGYNGKNPLLSLTKSEAKILGKLFEATTPMSYNDLAYSTGHSPNTIKVYVNSLKKKGVKFESIDAPNGCKLYAIPNKEKVKKLYNFS